MTRQDFEELVETYINGNISVLFEAMTKMHPTEAAMLAVMMCEAGEGESFKRQLFNKLY